MNTHNILVSILLSLFLILVSLHKQQFNDLIKDVKQRLPTFPQEESKDKEQGHKREFKEDISDSENNLESDFEPYVPFRKSKRSRKM